MSTEEPDVRPTINMLKMDQIPFGERWLQMKPIVSDLLGQKNVSKKDWQRLFWHTHQTVAWIEDGYVLLQENVFDL